MINERQLKIELRPSSFTASNSSHESLYKFANNKLMLVFSLGCVFMIKCVYIYIYIILIDAI